MIPNNCPGTRPAYASDQITWHFRLLVMNFALCQYVKAIVLGAWMGDHATVSGAHKVGCKVSTGTCFEDDTLRRTNLFKSDWYGLVKLQASSNLLFCIRMRLSAFVREFLRDAHISQDKTLATASKSFRECSMLSHHILSYLIISYHILSYLIISYHILSYPISLLYLIIYQQHSRDILSYHISYCPSPSSAVPCRACANSCITLSSLRSIADMSPLEPSPVRGGPLIQKRMQHWNYCQRDISPTAISHK